MRYTTIVIGWADDETKRPDHQVLSDLLDVCASTNTAESALVVAARPATPQEESFARVGAGFAERDQAEPQQYTGGAYKLYFEPGACVLLAADRPVEGVAQLPGSARV